MNTRPFTLRLIACFLMLASTAASLAQTSVAPLKDLAWSAQGNSIFFTATQDGKPVNMIRSGLPGKGTWAIYTGTLTDRVRLTYRDGQGLVDVLALDKGYRITVNTIGEERTEYRLYGANRKFIVGSVLYRSEDKRWMQGIMKSEIFSDYAALSQVTDVSQQMTTSLRARPTSLSIHIFRWPDLGFIGSAHAQSIDDLINGFFSTSAQQTREFFSAPGNVMVTAGGIGLAAFTVKLLSQSELVIGVAGAGTIVGLAPVLAAMGTGVAIGFAGEKVVNWAESKNISGRLSDLYSRLTRRTNYSEAPPPALPGAGGSQKVAGNTVSSTPPSMDSKVETEKFKQMMALTEQLDRIDQMDFDETMRAAETCRRSGNFDCADKNLDKAVKFATSKVRNRELLMQARQQVVADRRAAEEARRLEEQRQVALAEEKRQVALAEEKRRQQQAAEVAQRKSNDSDIFGRALFGAVGLGIIASGKGLPSEDKARIATGFVRDMSGEGQGQGLAQAERDIRASRAAAAPAGSAGRSSGGGNSGGGTVSLADSNWHDDLTVHENASGKDTLFRNHEASVPGSVITSQMGSQGAAQSFFGGQGGRVTSYSGCGACGVGSTITVVVRYSSVTDTHVYTRDR